MNCPKCKSGKNVKNGIVHRQQRYKCRECGCNFTKSKKKGYSMKMKVIALALYLSGVSMTMTGKIIGVSCQTIMRWIRELAQRCGELPKPSGKTVELELDEICHFLLKKSKKIWIWKAVCRRSRKLVGWYIGDRSEGSLEKFYEQIMDWPTKTFYADKYAVYQAVLPYNDLVQSKAETNNVERNNSTQRHWLARFKRRSIVVNRSIDMMEVSMRLFARFRVNGNINELLSIFR